MWSQAQSHEHTCPNTPVRAALAIVLMAGVAIAGCVGLEPVEDGHEPMMVYVTDAPADVTRLDVGIESVTVGDPPIPLDVQAESFDLAALRGPDDALLLASGSVPQGATDSLQISFAWAQATIGNKTFDLEVSAPLRLEDLSPESGLLLDIGLPESVTEENGVLRFEPTLTKLYSLDGSESDGLAWTEVHAPDGAWQVETATATGTAVEASTGKALGDPDGLADGAVDPTAIANSDDAKPDAQVHLTDQQVDGSAASEVVGWLATFAPDVGEADMQSKAESTGALFVFSLKSLPVAYLLATELQMDRLAAQAGVLDVEREQPLQFHDAESRLALRMPELTHPVTGLTDANGRPIDGRGVGVAIVDTGIYAAHSDILYEPLWAGGPVVQNLKVESQTFTEAPTTDTTGGHGTHVAGIIAGQGSSDADRRGVAPGASLYGFGVGEASTTVWAAQAFDWILQNGAHADPPIRVVSNSWSTGTTYDPGSVTNRLATMMAKNDIVVVFSAGNDGGDGSQNRVSAQCQIPQDGIICVAAYDDMGTGTRGGQVADYSSRGLKSDPSTWPDISAPGSNVLSTRPPVGSSTGFGTALGYVELSGTSQAAPHVAGVAALMLQMDPNLDAPAVEALIKNTAHPFSHGGSYSGGSHHAKGHGLLDAYGAVDAAS